MKVDRYFHIRPTIGLANAENIYRDGVPESRGGATVHVVGDTDSETVSFQVAYCSANDAFCRKIGRNTALQHAMTTINLAYLPEVLKDVAHNVAGRILKLSQQQRRKHPLWNLDYSFSTKYFKAKTNA